MMVREALIITKYLLKEHVVNPLFKKYRRIVLVIILFIIIISLLFLILSCFTSTGKGYETSTGMKKQDLGELIRGFMRSTGLDKDYLVDILSTVFFLVLAMNIIRGREGIYVSDAEYELVLTQPISMDTYFIGKTIYELFLGFLFTPLYFGMVPAFMDINGGDPKALFMPLALTLSFFVFLAVGGSTATILVIVLKRKGFYHRVRIALLAYILVATAHSLIIKRFSPLLFFPFRGFAELLVYPLTITATTADIMVSLSKTIIVTAVFIIVIYWFSKYIFPEDFISLRRITFEKKIKIQKTYKVRLNLETPDSAVRSYILGSSILNRRHILNASMLISVIMVILFIVRSMFLRTINVLGLDASFVTLFMIPIIVSSMGGSFLQSVIVNDIQAYWIYRVYLINLSSFARALMLKYIAYLLEILFIISCIDAVLAWNVSYLLFPVTVLPLVVITGFLVLVSTLYFASKKKIVKHMPTGMDVLEETVSAILWIVVVSSIMFAKIIFMILLSAEKSVIILESLVLTSTLVTIPLYMVFSGLLAKIAQRYDLVS